MIKTLQDIINLKGDGDLNELIVEDEGIVNHFCEEGMAGCEYLPDMGIGQDSDFEELLDYLGTNIVSDIEFEEGKLCALLYDENTHILVLSTDYENRFDTECPDETFYDFNNIKVIDKETAQKYIK
jgi:hypothetical protein